MSMSKALTTLVTIAIGASVFAQAPQPSQTKSAPRKASAPKSAPVELAPQPPAPEPAAQTGPAGVGGILIGMTKESIEAIPDTEPVSLTGPLSLKAPGPHQKQDPGVERWTGQVRMPSSAAPLDITLSIRDGVVFSIFIVFRDGQAHFFDAVGQQIADRYGNGVVSDKRREEDCIYRNGNSFKIRPGFIETIWTTRAADNSKIQTRIADVNIATCPSNLRDGMSPIKLKTLTISKVADEPVTKPASIF